MSNETIVLSEEQIKRIISRIAYQVIETFGDEKSLVVVGIAPRGTWVSDQICQQLKLMSTIGLSQITYDQNLRLEDHELNEKNVLLVDDIVNSGTTMMQAAGAISIAGAQEIKTACLVDRMHRKFPIHSDFTGLSLATTIQEHLSLNIETGPSITLH